MATNLPPLKDIEPLSPLVTRILGGNPSKFTLQGTNTYLIGSGPTRILLDTAQGLAPWRSSLSTLLPSPSSPSAEPSTSTSISISTVLLTHHHPDHILGVPDLLALFPAAQIYKHPASPSPSAPAAHYIPIPGIPAEQIHPIRDGDIFETDGATLRAIHTPGHTPDHMCFLLEEEGALFTGDNVLGHGTAVFADLPTYMASLEKMKNVPGFEGRAYPGHGEVIADGRGKVEGYIRHRRQREEEVVKTLGGDGELEGVTPGEVVKVVYKDVPANLHEAAEGGVVQVLAKLEGEGKVRRGEDGRWRLEGRDKGSL